MSSSIGENVRLTLFGQSHSPAIGMTLEGVPAGFAIDFDKLNAFMERRAPGRDKLTTSRHEADKPEFISGLYDGRTCGAPLTAIIRNSDARPGDYRPFESTPRPGHADFTANIKFGGYQDSTGGGHFSGRLTAPLCVAGGVCLQLLEAEGISVKSRILSIGRVKDEGTLEEYDPSNEIPTVSALRWKEMRELIESVRAAGDSVGGVVECGVYGLPAGLGDPIFGGMENRISAVVFGIPAVKGIEFGAGFASSESLGSENNDAFTLHEGVVVTKTNNCGGILGGITDGMPLTFRAAFKPTPSISAPQKTLDMSDLTEKELSVPGRHDPCVVLRALPCVEAAAAFAVYDAFLGRKREL